MDGVRAQTITDMPTSHNTVSVIEDIVCNRDEYVTKLEAEIDSKMRVLNAINSVYFYLKEPARSVIELRYFVVSNPRDIRRKKYNWQEIAEKLNYSEFRVKQIDCQIIRQILYKFMGVKV